MSRPSKKHRLAKQQRKKRSKAQKTRAGQAPKRRQARVGDACLPQESAPVLDGDNTQTDRSATTSALLSTRQSTAARRWQAASPVTETQLVEILGCPPELAQFMTLPIHAPRLDSRKRRGKAALIWPYKTRQVGGEMALSAIYRHTQGQIDQDFVGALEATCTSQRIQDTALFTIQGNANAPGKSPYTIFLVASPLDALAVHRISPGADVYALATPRIPQWLIHEWTHSGKNRMIIIGQTDADVAIIQGLVQNAGWYGMIQQSAVDTLLPDASVGPVQPIPNRTPAWAALCNHGEVGLKQHLSDTTITVYKPDRTPSDHGVVTPSRPVQRFLQTAKKLGLSRTDREHWFSNLEASSAALEASLRQSTQQHVAGIISQPGQGKTHATLTHMLDEDSPQILVTPTVDLAKEAYEKIMAMKPADCTRTIRLHEPRGPDNCARYAKVTLLQDANRGPYALACKMADLDNSIPGDCEHAQNCGYLQGLRLDSHADIGIACQAALNSDSSLLNYTPEPIRDPETGEWESGDTIQRRIKVDEETPTAVPLKLTHQHLGENIRTLIHWLGKPAWLRARIKGAMGEAFTEASLNESVAAYKVFQEALSAMNTEYSRWSIPEKSQTPVAIRMSGVWRDLADAYRKLPKALTLMDGSTLAERPVLHNGEEAPLIPKQWLAALVEALKADMVWIYKSNLVIGKEGGLWKNFLEQGGLYMDASMGLIQKQIITHQKNGAVYTVPVHQPYLNVIQVLDGQQHGKAALKGHALPGELQRLMRLWKPMITAHGHGAVAGLTHKALHDLATAIFLRDQPDPDLVIQKALSALGKKNRQPGSKDWQIILGKLGMADDPAKARTQYDITVDDAWLLGHWGKDDRGHNRWEKVTAGFCWGVPLNPPDQYQIEYAIQRVILARQGISWPEWDGSVTRHQVIQTNGGERQITTSFPLPTVPEARAFVLDLVNAQIAQGIGRWRGVRRTAENPIDIHLFMGDFPVAAVGHDHMLPNLEYVTDLESTLVKKATKEVSVLIAVTQSPDNARIVMEAIREAVHQSFGFDPGSRLGRRVTRSIKNKLADYAREHHLSLKEAAQALVRKIATFLPDPRAYPTATDHYTDRLLNRAHWCRIFMGTGPWADAALNVLHMLYEATFIPQPPEAPPG
ncbi:MAG: hypothetical protein WCY67_06220 [Acidithiobacillus sp.]